MGDSGNQAQAILDEAVSEQAVAAVSRYVFAPARQDGKPVKVDLYVDVNFSIH